MKKNNLEKEMEELLKEYLAKYFAMNIDNSSKEQLYKAMAMLVRDMLLEKRQNFWHEMHKNQSKRVYYLCMEFLLGRSLKNNLYNLELEKAFRQILKKHNISIDELYDCEPDAGLGNGGLGRLAACFMDALAAGQYPAIGYSLRYEYGLFKQKIVDGWQVELPDNWLPGGAVWLSERTDRVHIVKVGGSISEEWTADGVKIHYENCDELEAVPYDMMISGAQSRAVSLLRVWRPRAMDSFDMTNFAKGNYMQAMMKYINADVIGKVLYPSDNTMEGKALRLIQQYFLVSASAQDIIKTHLDHYESLDSFPEKNAIHINDTHPAMIIPELMRIFMDDYGYSWDKAFELVHSSVTYTNHTVLAEALEVWPEELIIRIVPRIHMILTELNRRYCEAVWQEHPGDWDRCERMAIISYNQVRMANLSVIGSHKVNGVSKMHSEILKNDIFRDFCQDQPDKFTNVTNGIAYRRWLCQANPLLADLLDDCIGSDYRKDGSKLADLAKFAKDDSVLERLYQVKQANKKRFVDSYFKSNGIILNPDSVFDVQVKRLHEYKRQLMNALQILSLYVRLKNNPDMDFKPQTFIFGAKAAAGYDMAKQIIRFIYYLGEELRLDPLTRDKLRIVFLENYSVTVAEEIIPAADISQQISLAGKEASGTGNMKLMINGAVTLGTLDGANVEMAQAVGTDNIYIFGLKDYQVEAVLRDGYNPYQYYKENELIRETLDYLKHGIGGQDFDEIYSYLLKGNNGQPDPYLCICDSREYAMVRNQMIVDYDNRKEWNRKALMNIAGASHFTADESIKNYAENIWNVKPL